MILIHTALTPPKITSSVNFSSPPSTTSAKLTNTTRPYLSKLLRQLSPATFKHLQLDPTADLIQNLFYIQGINHLPDDDEDLNDIHHPFDLLDKFPDDKSFYDYEDEHDYDAEEF
jgi:hypothetical protein